MSEIPGTRHRLVIANAGDTDVCDVDFELASSERAPHVIREDELAAVANVLAPGTAVKLPMAVHIGTAMSFDLDLRWRSSRDGDYETTTQTLLTI